MKRLFLGAQQIVTCRGPARARRGAEQGALDVMDRAAVLVDGERVATVGPVDTLRREAPDAEIIEVSGVLFPGFVDAHTHAVFGAARTADHERRALGESYKAIAAAGGGILESVRDVRGRDEEDLLTLTRDRLWGITDLGTTTVEAKSGYGLDADAELKQLRVLSRLKAELPITVVSTFLGAHEVPPEFRDRRDAYVSFVTDEVLPLVAGQGLAQYCDVFCEPGVFTPGESRRVLEAARAHGLGLRLHADELDGSGGAELAAELGAASADHLAAISEDGIRALGQSATVAILLPGTMLFLGRSGRAPARRLIDAGVPVALATDFNPGSSPTMSLPLMMTLGMSQLGMSAAEVVMAVTVNAAASLGLADRVGQIAPGFNADLVAMDVQDWREVPYWYGANLVEGVWKRGSPCSRPG